MLTLDAFERAATKVKEVTLETKLIESPHFSAIAGNRVFFKPGVDSPNDVAARNFDMQMNMHDRGGHSMGR